LWKRVHRLEVPAWAARRAARQTHPLPLAAARWVDVRLAMRGTCGPVVTDRLAAEAAALFDPAAHAAREAKAAAEADVELRTPDPGDFEGTSDLFARGDTAILKDFYALVCAIAHQLHLAGDPDPLGTRKVKAIGLITTLIADLARGHAHRHAAGPASGTAAGPADGPAGSGAEPAASADGLDLGGLDLGGLDLGALLTRVAGKLAAGRILLHLLVTAADLDGDSEAVGKSFTLGPATVAKIRDWVGHRQVVIRPVLNMHRTDAVDGHDPPPWMAEAVRLRDGTCVFPMCQVHADDCDLDHEIPYTPIADGGPPGQTHPDNPSNP
jgi:hypothetical protein